MIVVITGVPGSGKTLYTIDAVKRLSEAEGRPVFYSGIPELKLPWIEHDPTKWEELPAGAIMVIDECQRVFRPRANGSTVPSYIAAMETHRHKGIDIWLMTQHPMLIDQNIRRLCGRHIHVDRIFGFHASTLSEWQQIKENCDKNKSGADQKKWKYPKEVFDYYKSSEQHTHKARIPSYVYVFGLAVSLLIGLVYYVYQARFAPALAHARGEKVAATDQPLRLLGPDNGDAPSQKGGMSPAQWLAAQKPRVPGLAYTAPVFDKVTQPTHAPYPAACVASKTKCGCYSQQATKLEVPEDLCRSIAKDGFFMAWDERKAMESGPARQPVATAQPAPEIQPGSGLGGFNTSRVASAEPVSTVNPPQSPQAGPKNHANAQ